MARSNSVVNDRVSSATPPFLNQVCSSQSKVAATPNSSALVGVVNCAKVVSGSLGVEEAWVVVGEDVRGVRVAPRVVEEGKRALHSGIVGYLKTTEKGLQRTDQWINQACGLVPVHLSL